MGHKVELVGCKRYSLKGDLYEKGNVYLVRESVADVLLRKTDEMGNRLFRRVEEDVREVEGGFEKVSSDDAEVSEDSDAGEVLEQDDDEGGDGGVSVDETDDEDLENPFDQDDPQQS